MKRGLTTNQDGFSIIELMTTLAILSWVMLTIITFMIQIDGILDKTERRLTAITTLYEKYQEYETKSFTSLTQGTALNNYEVEDFVDEMPADLREPRSAKVYIRDVTPTLKKLDVRISYKETKDKVRTINISTGIQESGVGR